MNTIPRLPAPGTTEHDDAARRMLALMGAGLDGQIRNTEYLRDRNSPLYNFETHALLMRARQIRAGEVPA